MTMKKEEKITELYVLINSLLDKISHLEKQRLDDLFAARRTFWAEGFNLGVEHGETMALQVYVDATQAMVHAVETE
jgi:hypothetical protein